jgi:cell division septal protein FtsQ
METIPEIDNSDTVKVMTVVFFVLGLIVPLWIITLPLFWFLAYKNYKSPVGKPMFEGHDPVSSKPIQKQSSASIPTQISSNDKFASLEKINELKEKGILTEAEFQEQKNKILNS